jgi:hypothetical protein
MSRNVYVPSLQYEGGVALLFRSHRGKPFASSALMDLISKAVLASTTAVVAAHGLPLIPFEKGQPKDDVIAAHLARFTGDEGVLFVGQAYPWLVRSTAMVKHDYFFAVDRDVGPLFL